MPKLNFESFYLITVPFGKQSCQNFSYHNHSFQKFLHMYLQQPDIHKKFCEFLRDPKAYQNQRLF